MQCGDAGVPGHVPGRHIPKQDGARLQRGRFTEQEEDATPLGAFPGDVRLDEDDVRDERTKTAQGGEKTELADLFSQVEPEPGLMEIGAAMLLGESGLDRQAQRAEDEQK